LTGSTRRPVSARQETTPAGACQEMEQTATGGSAGVTGTPVRRWRIETGPGDPAQTAIGGATVFASDSAGNLRALDAPSGQERWSVSLSEASGLPVTAGELVLVGNASDGLIAFDAERGDERWRFDPRASFAATAVCGGQIVAGGEAGLFALDAESGEERWKLLTGSRHGRPVTDGALAVVRSADGVLYAVEASTGEERWSVPFGGSGGTPALGGGAVIAAVERGRLGERIGTLTAFDAASGSIRWSLELPERIQGRPVVAGERVYLGVGGALVAFATASGDELWRVETGGIQATPAVTGATVYLAAGYGTPSSGYGELFALATETGTERWQFTLGYLMMATPTVAEGLVVVGSADPYTGGAIVAIGEG
jgi:outer membrane protein assembly factor BamB